MGLTKGSPGDGDKGDAAHQRGLAALLSSTDDNAILLSSSDSKPSSSNSYDSEAALRSTACLVLDLSTAQEQVHLGPGRDPLAGALAALQEKASQAQQEGGAAGSLVPPHGLSAGGPASASSTSAPDAAAGASSEHPKAGLGAEGLTCGRLGPPRVVLDRASARGQLQYSNGDTAAESLNNFSSFRANACAYAGKWMYEATVQTAWQPGIQQIGWATIQCPFTAEEGVGDAPDSYAYDGKRVRKWNVKSQPYGEAWAAGDVIGSCLDLERGEISFLRNGVNMGVAFRNVRSMQPGCAYFPAVSLSYTERCELNCGARPFLYPVPGYQPLQAPPAESQQLLATYLLGCLQRLARLAAQAPGSDVWGRQESPWPQDSAGPAPQAEVAARGAEQRAEVLTRATQHRASGGPPSVGPASRQAVAGPSDRGPAVVDAACPAVRAPAPALSWEDATLLAGAICSHLVPVLLQLPASSSPTTSAAGVAETASSGTSASGDALPAGAGLVSEYFVHGALLQALLQLHGTCEPHDAPATRAAMRLLQVGMDPAVFSSMCSMLLEALSRRCVVAPMKPEEFPYSASYPYISLATCLVQGVPAVLQSLLQHKALYPLLEGFMARKPPSPEDLKGLLPTVWWPGCKDESSSEGRMRAGLAAFAAAKLKVEEQQYGLLSVLVGRRTADGRDDALVAFVRYLLQRNRGATRDVQPAGLSDPNVLLSVWFVLLKLLHGALPTDGQFLAGEYFVKAAQRGSIDPTNDLARLGGLLSFLLRESPVPASDLGPIPVQLPPALYPPIMDAAMRTLAKSPAIVTELLHLSTMLYTLRGAGIIRQIHAQAQTLASHLSGLEQIERQLEARLLGPLPTHSSSSSGGGSSSSGSVQAAVAPGASTAGAAAAAGPARVSATDAGSDGAVAGDGVSASVGSGSTASGAGAGAGASTPPPPPAPQPAPTPAPAPASTPGSVSAPYLHEARSMLRGEVQTSVRYIRLLNSTLFGGWKMEALLRQSSWLAQALLGVLRQRGPLLAFVPTCYLELQMDVLAAYRAADVWGTPFATPTQLRQHGLDELLQFLTCVLADQRIRNPDTREQLLGAASGLLDHAGMAAVVEDNTLVAGQLVHAAVSLFDSKQWHPVCSLLAHIVRGTGLGAPRPPTHTTGAPAASSAAAPSTTGPGAGASLSYHAFRTGITTSGGAAGTSFSPASNGGGGGGGGGGGAGIRSASSSAPAAPLPVCAGLLRQALRPGAPEFKGFCDRLFNTVNWAVTEGTSTITALHEVRRPAAGSGGGAAAAASRRPQDEQQQVRKVVLMLDLTKTLLRVLEFMAQHLPHAFLAPARAINLTRLLEVVPFVLGHFTTGPDARRLNELLQASQQLTGPPQTLMRLGTDRQYTVIHVEKPLFEKVNKAELLIPVVGTLVALWRADREGRGRSDPDQAATTPHKAGVAASSPAPVAKPEAKGEQTGGEGGAAGEEDEEDGRMHDTFLEALAEVADDRVQSQLAFLRTFDFERSLPSGAVGLHEGLADFAQMYEELQEVRRSLHPALQSPRLTVPIPINNLGTPGTPHTPGTPGSLGPSGSPADGLGVCPSPVGSLPPLSPHTAADVPEEFLDPITTVIMTDPVTLPDSQVTLDRSTIERQLSIQGTDPFSRKELTMDMVKPNTELKARIRAYLAERRKGRQ